MKDSEQYSNGDPNPVLLGKSPRLDLAEQAGPLNHLHLHAEVLFIADSYNLGLMNLHEMVATGAGCRLDKQPRFRKSLGAVGIVVVVDLQEYPATQVRILCLERASIGSLADLLSNCELPKGDEGIDETVRCTLKHQAYSMRSERPW